MNVTTTNISFVVLYVNLFEFIAYLYTVCAAPSHRRLFSPRLFACLLRLLLSFTRTQHSLYTMREYYDDVGTDAHKIFHFYFTFSRLSLVDAGALFYFIFFFCILYISRNGKKELAVCVAECIYAIRSYG